MEDPIACFDLVVIGSGPAALALVSRILESRPAALYTEDEHRHLHWLNKGPLLRTHKSGRGAERVIKSATEAGDDCHCGGRIRILVIDKLGQGWMGLWNRLFAAYDIRHLRSPLFFHPDPSDFDSLLAFAEYEGRATQGGADFIWRAAHTANLNRTAAARSKKKEKVTTIKPTADPELIEIPGVVGKEVSKHKAKGSRPDRRYGRMLKSTGPAVNERDRKDYFTPGTKLFHDFVQKSIVDHYGIGGSRVWPNAKEAFEAEAENGEADDAPVTLVKGEVVDMRWSETDANEIGDGFRLKLSDGSVVSSKAVVSAVGPGGRPAVPRVLLGSLESWPECSPAFGDGWAHSSALGSPSDTAYPPSPSRGRSTLVVIGGGLTSAQIVSVGLRRGFDRVVMLMRGHLKVKPFDIGLEWMGRYSNLCKMQYWQTDDPAERLRMLRGARNGGSITPPYARLLREYEAAGRVEIRCFTEITTAERTDEGRWKLNLHCNKPKSERERAREAAEKARRAEDEDEEESQARDETEEHADDGGNEHGQSHECGSQADEVLDADFIVAATGPQLGFDTLPFLQHLCQTRPIRHEGGLPVLTEELQYTKDIPLFCVGAYSALQVSGKHSKAMTARMI